MLKYGKVMKALYNKELDMYAIRQYHPVSARMYTPLGADVERESRVTYDFKKYGKRKVLIKKEVLKLKEYLGCDKIAVVPSHDILENNLQKLFSYDGTVFKRITKVEQRKYHHGKSISEDYIKSIDIVVPGDNNITFLLLDDVCVTGGTILFFEKILLDLGFKVKKLVLAFHAKLAFEYLEFEDEKPKNVSIFKNMPFVVGDIVYLKGDINCDNPLTIIDIFMQELDDYQRFVICAQPFELVQFTYITKNGDLKKEILPAQSLRKNEE